MSKLNLKILSSEQAIRIAIYSTLITSIISAALILNFNSIQLAPVTKETADKFINYFKEEHKEVNAPPIYINLETFLTKIESLDENSQLIFNFVEINNAMNIVFDFQKDLNNPINPNYFHIDENGKVVVSVVNNVNQWKDKYKNDILRKINLKDPELIDGNTKFNYCLVGDMKKYLNQCKTQKIEHLKIFFGKLYYKSDGNYGTYSDFVKNNENRITTIIKAYRKGFLGSEVVDNYLLREYNKPCPTQCGNYIY